MFNSMFVAIIRFASFLKGLSVQRAMVIAMTGLLAISMPINLAQTDQSSLGERFRERMQQIDRSTERPKTTGEFLDEVEGDVPLNERIYNTARDSAEAFKQFGSEFSIGAQESAKNVKDNTVEAGKDLVN